MIDIRAACGDAAIHNDTVDLPTLEESKDICVCVNMMCAKLKLLFLGPFQVWLYGYKQAKWENTKMISAYSNRLLT